MTKIGDFTRSDSLLELAASRNYVFSGVSILTNGFYKEETEEIKLFSQEIMNRNGFKVI